MFTGIIQEVGVIRQVQKKGDGLALQVKAPESCKSLKKGGSISINGACQTAAVVSREWFEVMAASETISRTNFGLLRPGMGATLELPLALNDPLGGHLMTGHIDDTGKIVSIRPGAESTIMQISFKSEYNKYLIEKGSVAVDGISLTVFDVKSEMFSVSLIPDTIERTNLRFRNVGDIVNLEFDQIGKYIEKFLDKSGNRLTMDYLNKHGFMRQ